MSDDKIVLIPTIQCSDRKGLHHSLENRECPYCQIKSLKAQLKREQATVDLISLTSNEPKCGMISMALLKEVARETVKVRE